MNVRDRSNGSFQGSITRHGCDHVKTSDRVVASDFGNITGEGPTQGMPHIPGNPVPEVATVNGDTEPCSASGVDAAGSIHQGDPAEKCASVSTHPNLMSSHRHGSITHEDHKAIHSGVEGTKKLEKPPVADKAESTSTPVTYQGGRQPFSNNSMRLSGLPVKAESTSPVISRVGKGGVARGPAVYNSDTGKFGSV